MSTSKTRNEQPACKVPTASKALKSPRALPACDESADGVNARCPPDNPVDVSSRQVGRTSGKKKSGKDKEAGLAQPKENEKTQPPVTPGQSPPGPRQVQKLNQANALRLVNRFRQLRSIDLAAGLFPERAFKAALSAAQRITKSLVSQKMLRRYRSLSGQTYYALGEAGARWLRQQGRESDCDAKASASRVCEKTNPEHALWSSFTALACQARGLRAMTEKELVPGLMAGKDFSQRRHVLTIADERGLAKGLLPDAVGFSDRHVVWFEIDRSERGSVRLCDLAALVRSCGAPLFLGSKHTDESLVLSHVVVLCKTQRIYRKHIAYLTSVHPVTGVPRVRTLGNEPALIEIAPGVFDVMKDVETRLSDGRVALQRTQVGRVHFQLLPTWLSSFSYRPGSRHDGWFWDGYLPFSNAPKGWHPMHNAA